jgi:hypothetical protein
MSILNRIPKKHRVLLPAIYVGMLCIGGVLLSMVALRGEHDLGEIALWSLIGFCGITAVAVISGALACWGARRGGQQALGEAVEALKAGNREQALFCLRHAANMLPERRDVAQLLEQVAVEQTLPASPTTDQTERYEVDIAKGRRFLAILEGVTKGNVVVALALLAIALVMAIAQGLGLWAVAFFSFLAARLGVLCLRMFRLWPDRFRFVETVLHWLALAAIVAVCVWRFFEAFVPH